MYEAGQADEPGRGSEVRTPASVDDQDISDD